MATTTSISSNGAITTTDENGVERLMVPPTSELLPPPIPPRPPRGPHHGTHLAAPEWYGMSTEEVVTSVMFGIILVELGLLLYYYSPSLRVTAYTIVVLLAIAFRYLIKWIQHLAQTIADGTTAEIARQVDNWRRNNPKKATFLRIIGVNLDKPVAIANKLASRHVGSPQQQSEIQLQQKRHEQDDHES